MSSMARRLGAILFLVLGAIEAVLYLRGLPIVRELPGWFFRPIVVPHGPAFALLVAACAPTACKWALHKAEQGEHRQALCALIAIGSVAQFALHFIVPAGIDHIFERLHVGHGEFLHVAAARRGQFWATLRNYDDLFAAQQLGAFAGSKPPGTLAVYMILDAVAQWGPVQWLLSPLLDAARSSHFVAPVAELAALIVALLPPMTFLTVVPLVKLTVQLTRDFRSGYAAALVFMSSPAALLVDLHLDGALFPLLTVTSIWFAARGAAEQRWGLSLASGSIAIVGAYASFGLLPTLGLAVAVSFLCALQTELEAPSPQVVPVLRELVRERGSRLLPAVLVLVGALCGLGLLVAVLGFQPLRRFHDALAFHAAWKGAVPTALWRKLSLLEFGLYAGLPLMGAVLFEAARSVGDVFRRRRLPLSLWTLGVLILLLILAAQQGTNEVSRLWLFMVPLLALSAGAGLCVRSVRAERDRAWLLLSAVQAGLAVVLRVTQPW